MIQKINMKKLMIWLVLALLVLFSGFVAVSLPSTVLSFELILDKIYGGMDHFYQRYPFMNTLVLPISVLIIYFGYPILYGVALSFSWGNFKNKKISQAFMWQLLPLSSIFLAIVIIAIAFLIN